MVNIDWCNDQNHFDYSVTDCNNFVLGNGVLKV